MLNEKLETETQQVMTQVTHEVDCFRKIKDAETGVVSVKRWREDRQVSANLMFVKSTGGVFHNGARIA